MARPTPPVSELKTSNSENAAAYQQIPFGTDDFAENPEPRVPCVLILDVSRSMEGLPIDELNAGLLAYRDDLLADRIATKRVEVAVVTFGKKVELASDFCTVPNFAAPYLIADGPTPMGDAVERAMEILELRKQSYRANGIAYYRPWLFLITDGEPTDRIWKRIAEQAKTGDRSKRFAFFCVGVEGANFEVLAQFTNREPLRLQGLRFRELFLWLSSSQRSVSHSTPGDAVRLENPTAPGGWASI